MVPGAGAGSGSGGRENRPEKCPAPQSRHVIPCRPMASQLPSSRHLPSQLPPVDPSSRHHRRHHRLKWAASSVKLAEGMMAMRDAGRSALIEVGRPAWIRSATCKLRADPPPAVQPGGPQGAGSRQRGPEEGPARRRAPATRPIPATGGWLAGWCPCQDGVGMRGLGVGEGEEGREQKKEWGTRLFCGSPSKGSTRPQRSGPALGGWARSRAAVGFEWARLLPAWKKQKRTPTGSSLFLIADQNPRKSHNISEKKMPPQ